MCNMLTFQGTKSFSYFEIGKWRIAKVDTGSIHNQRFLSLYISKHCTEIVHSSFAPFLIRYTKKMDSKNVTILALLFALAQSRNLPENLTGTCVCTVNVSNQEVTYTNDCNQRFSPNHEVLVMPMHPGTGSPRVKTRCICTCKLDLRGGSFYARWQTNCSSRL